jgi:hypothetical protein
MRTSSVTSTRRISDRQGNCRTFKVIRIAAERPEKLPAEFWVFNAPRPIYGSIKPFDGTPGPTAWTWEEPGGPRGRHFAAVSPDDPNANQWLSHNDSARAHLVEYIGSGFSRKSSEVHQYDNPAGLVNTRDLVVGERLTFEGRFSSENPQGRTWIYLGDRKTFGESYFYSTRARKYPSYAWRRADGIVNLWDLTRMKCSVKELIEI